MKMTALILPLASHLCSRIMGVEQETTIIFLSTLSHKIMYGKANNLGGICLDKINYFYTKLNQ